MIELLIFHFHIVGALYAYTKRWQEAGVKEGLLAIALIGLVFVIGWSITGAIANVVFPPAWESVWFRKDTLGLVLLFIPEVIFFKVFFLKNTNETNEAVQ